VREIAKRILRAAYEAVGPRDEIAEIALLSGVKNFLKTLERYEKNRNIILEEEKRQLEILHEQRDKDLALLQHKITQVITMQAQRQPGCTYLTG